MNLRQMEAFKTLMLAGSVTAAAELLRLSQPTISKLIAQLESQTQLRLFERRRRRLIPTREAHTLLKNVERALSAIDDVGRSATELARTHTGALRIACIPSIGTGFMPKAIASFLKKHPETKPTIYVRTANYVIEHVSGMRADIGLVSEDVDQPSVSSTVFQERPGAICVLPQRHALARKKALQPKDFDGQPFVSIGRDNAFRYLIDRAFVDAGVDRRVVVEATHLATAFALVAEGAGLTVVDPYTAVSCLKRDEVVLRPFHPEIKFVVNLLKPANNPVPLIVEEFLAHLDNEQKAMTRVLKDHMLRGL
jgi:DNA-binding transcriptional LysR family regulator